MSVIKEQELLPRSYQKNLPYECIVVVFNRCEISNVICLYIYGIKIFLTQFLL